MAKITLQGMEFFANHGYYDEEQKIGNKFGVDLIVTADLSKAARNDSLANTVNYERLYQIVKSEMLKPSRLLENIGKRIMHKIFTTYPVVEEIEVTVSKYNPPIGGICHKASVILLEKNI